jgi:hypothetical protein
MGVLIIKEFINVNIYIYKKKKTISIKLKKKTGKCIFVFKINIFFLY